MSDFSKILAAALIAASAAGSMSAAVNQRSISKDATLKDGGEAGPAMTAQPRRVATDVPMTTINGADLIACLVYTDDSDRWPWHQAYSFRNNASDPDRLSKEDCDFSRGFQIVNDTLYGVNSDGNYGVYDLMNWSTVVAATQPAPDNMRDAATTAMDYTTGTAYGCVVANGEWSFAQLDYKNKTVNVICALNGEPGFMVLNGLGIDAHGNGYGVDSNNDFVSVDLASGLQTVIGPTGTSGYYITGGCIDPNTGRFFYATCDEPSALYEIDKETGAAYLIANWTPTPDFEMTSPFVLYYPRPDKAPGDPENLNVTFNNGSTSGTITFDVPTICFDGSSNSGQVTYYISLNGTQVQKGTANCGDKVTYAAQVETDGLYTVQVNLENNAGRSIAACKSLYVGNDNPVMTPVAAALSNNDTQIDLKWDAVSEAKHDGYVDFSNITYTIYDAINDTQVGTTHNTNYSISLGTVTDFTPYCYYVTATSALTSAPIYSNQLSLGRINPPYTHNFKSPFALAGWTVLDSNNDGVTWVLQPEDGRVDCTYNSNMAADDYLVTPPVALTGGITYTVAPWLRSRDYEEKFSLVAGTAPTAAALTTVLIPETAVNESTAKAYEGTFECPADGTYYFAVHKTSDADMYHFYLVRFTIAASTTGISDVTAEQGQAEYYDLMGQQVANPQHGIFIKKTGTKAVKIAL